MSKLPLVKSQIAWIAVIPQLALLGLFAVCFYALGFKQPAAIGAVLYLLLSFLLKILIPKSHREGMKLLKRGEFESAIAYFKKSADFFSKNQWVDKYRSLTLLSSSKMLYKEMALNNIAFSYSQINNGKKAQEYYELTLKEFPDNALAKAALNLIYALEKNSHN